MEKNHKATLAGGCFWCMETVYKRLKGVKEVIPGYSGGTKENPTYQEVCSDTTGHAEVVQITFEPEIISYRDLLEIFFFVHNPTTLNQQGNDIGTQYRSAIFYHSDKQKEIARAFIMDMEEGQIFDDPIVTQLVKFETFYPAEYYHINYYDNNPGQAYCSAVISPKLARFREKYKEKLL